MATSKTTDSDFTADVLQSDKPVLVDFWAEWCGPCKAIGPALEEIAGEKLDSLSIVKLNIDENPLTPQKYNVRGIPTLLIFKNGEVVAEKMGALVPCQNHSWKAGLINRSNANFHKDNVKRCPSRAAFYFAQEHDRQDKVSRK